MVERDCPPAKDGALPSAGATRRRLISVGHAARPAGSAAPGASRDDPGRPYLAGRRIHPGHPRTRQRAQGRTVHA
ncbi:hypothetical protein G6F32_015167 [Rhizopus arrhizus]|nr:hypothetical protein G6F32_015167 [Rhizopus arrhizus]